MVGARYERSDATVFTRYFHKDHLGSIQTITNESGIVVERNAYDPWGRRRFPNGQDDTTGQIASLTSRGFTGEEHIEEAGLVHLNGRVYDPLLARFASADPTVDSPQSTQSWNRYAYLRNNPLNATDPTGFGFFSSVVRVVSAPFKAALAVVKAVNSVPLVSQVVNIGVVAGATWACGACAIGVAAANSALTAGVNSGNLGVALRAGVISGATAAAFYGVGDYTEFHQIGFTEALRRPGMFALNIVGHAAVGCASQAASGGSCQSGALSGAAGSIAGPATRGIGFEAGLVVNAVVGGVASVAGGGKFANGATTAAFGYLFNQAQQRYSHSYDQTDAICVTSNPGCTPDNVMDAVLHFPHASGSTTVAVQPGETSYVAPFGHVTTTVDYANYTVTNTTESDHEFCCGTVVHKIVTGQVVFGGRLQEGLFVSTIGTGTNSSLANAAISSAGSPAFGGECTFSNTNIERKPTECRHVEIGNATICDELIRLRRLRQGVAARNQTYVGGFHTASDIFSCSWAAVTIELLGRSRIPLRL
jgi:RHS repeat-associated protein